MTMTISMTFDKDKLMEDCKDYILKNLKDVGEKHFFESVMKVAVKSIASTTKFTIDGESSPNIFKDG